MKAPLRVAVVGAGLAGLTAAVRCADAGASVVLLEAKPRLGGLTCSFRRGELTVDNGQHVFLRCCTRYLALLDRLGVSDQVAQQPRLDVCVVEPGAGRRRLRRNALPAPLHLAGALLRYGALSPRQRLAAARAARALALVDPRDPANDEVTFGSWLREHGQDTRAVAALWDLIGIATLNARADEASLSLAATVFQLGLLTDAPSGDIGWPLVPLQQLHGDPAVAALAAAGASVRTGARVAAVERRDEAWLVGMRGGDEVVADRVVLALPPTEVERLLPDDALAQPPGWSQRLGSAPIVNVHLVYDRRVLDVPFLAAIGSPVQWVFDRTLQAGLRSGQCLAVSLSAADDLVDLPAARLRQLVVPALAELLPDTNGAALTDVFVTRERHATFRPLPGTARLRPPPVTRCPGLLLAGAWTDTGWPATMEGAVRSGEAAAAAALAGPPVVPARLEANEVAA